MGNSESLTSTQVQEERWKLSSTLRRKTIVEEKIQEMNEKRKKEEEERAEWDRKTNIPWQSQVIHGLYEPKKKKGSRIKDKLYSNEKEQADRILEQNQRKMYEEDVVGMESLNTMEEGEREEVADTYLVSILPQSKTTTLLITATNMTVNSGEGRENKSFYYAVVDAKTLGNELDHFLARCDTSTMRDGYSKNIIGELLERKLKWNMFYNTLAEVMRRRYFDLSKDGVDFENEKGEGNHSILLSLKILDETSTSQIVKPYQIRIRLHASSANTLGKHDIHNHVVSSLFESYSNANHKVAEERNRVRELEDELERMKATNSALQKRCTKLQILMKGDSQYQQVHEIPTTLVPEQTTSLPASPPYAVDASPAPSPHMEFQPETDGEHEGEAIINVDEPFMLPISRVLQILQRWKTRKNLTRAEFNSISYIISVIQNDALYQVDVNSLAQREKDKEMKKWIRSEFSVKRNERASVVLWIKAYAKALTFARILTEAVMKNANKTAMSHKLHKTPRNLTSINFPPAVTRCLSDVDSLETFNVFKLAEASDGHALYYIGLHLFQHYDLIRRFHIKLSVLRNFLNVIESGYLNNPYHNKVHAADVLQTLHGLIQSGDMRFFLSDLDIFSLMVSAIVHDYAHPGVNNAFEVRARTENALLYNDQSVLENYHLTNTFRLMQQQPFNIFADMDPDEAAQVRQNVIQTVLSTDVSRHFAIISQVRASILKKFHKNKPEDTTTLCKLLLKCADVSNPTKPNGYAVKWADMIMEEFYLQGDRERSNSWNVSPFMDRTKPNQAQCQVGFIQYIVRPLFESLAQFEPQCAFLITHMNENESFWKDKVEQQKSKENNENKNQLKIRDMHKIQEVEDEGEDGDANTNASS